MSVNISTRYATISIEDFINWTDETERRMIHNNRAIINMCLTNGTMGRKDQLKLRELYPRLYEEVQKFLNQKKRGYVFIYEEEGKPKVVNVFIHTTAKQTTSEYEKRRSAERSIKAYIRTGKIPPDYVFIDNENGKHRQMIKDTLYYHLNWRMHIDELRTERRQENE